MLSRQLLDEFLPRSVGTSIANALHCILLVHAGVYLIIDLSANLSVRTLARSSQTRLPISFLKSTTVSISILAHFDLYVVSTPLKCEIFSEDKNVFDLLE